MLNALKFATSFESQSNQCRIDCRIVMNHCEIDLITLILYKKKKVPVVQKSEVLYSRWHNYYAVELGVCVLLLTFYVKAMAW